LLSRSDSHLLHPILTVSQLTSRVKDLIEDVFEDIYVVGEISNAKVHPSGHWYFSLKDKDATLACVSFKNTNQSFKFRLEDGLMMVASGRLSVYPPKGSYQLVVASLKPVGVGEWQLAFEQLKQRLAGEGLLDASRKKTIPLVPRTIGVVTSPAGAAIKDIISALSRRNKNVSIVIGPVKVQGEGSAEEIADAIANLQEIAKVEVILLARGGGSIEDLWAFNTELVARAVANCSVPTISGIGHETDITICDLVADMRAPTPTAAAELVASGHSQIFEKCAFLQTRLIQSIKEKLSACRSALKEQNPLNVLTTYLARLKQQRLKVDYQKERLAFLIAKKLTAARYTLRENAQKLVNLGPLNVLGRGFAILRNLKGDVLRASSQTQPGELVEALLEHGKLSLVVKSSSETWH